MSFATIFDGFQKISPLHGIYEDRAHFVYKVKGKLPEPAVCSQCGAVFYDGHWQWIPVPADTQHAICPACHRIQKQDPAGFLTLDGEFFCAHSGEILNIVHNHEKQERAKHPLKRVMRVEEKDGMAIVTTTDIRLAFKISEALQHAYQGELEFYYNPEQNLLRVSWTP